MSDNTPTFTEALETLAKALNINFSTFAGYLFEDVELAKEAFLKRAKEAKSDVEKEGAGAQSRKFNCVDFWPAMDSNPDDLDAALHKLGVDKPDDEDSVECSDGTDCARCEAIENANSNITFHVSDIDDAFKKFQRLQQRKAAGYIRRDVTTGNVESKPALSTWKITSSHDSWGDETVEAETIDIDPAEGVFAYIGDDLVFHAPAGTYSYVRKVG